MLTNCPTCAAPLKTIPAGISKKTGNAYSAFQICSMDCGWKPPRNAPAPQYATKPPNTRESAIGDAMTRKEESINKNIDRKEQGMIFMSSVREAGNWMLYAMSLNQGLNEDQLKEEFWKQQKYFYEQIKESPQR